MHCLLGLMARALLLTVGLLALVLAACPQPQQYPPVPPTPTNPTNRGLIAAGTQQFQPTEVIDASIVSEAGLRFDATAFELDTNAR